MAPTFHFPTASDLVSQSSTPSRPQGTILESIADFQMPYQQNKYQQVGEEVDYFASQLDRYNADLRGSLAEKRGQVFKLVDSYYTYTQKRIARLRERQFRQRAESWMREGSGDMDVDEVEDGAPAVTSEELRRVEEEAQTWDLLRRTLPLRYGDQTAPQPEAQNQQSRSRKEWWDEFLLTDSAAREKKVVLEWLQNTANHGPPIDEVVSELQQNADRGDILAHGWLHTRSKIKLQKSVNGYQGVLDPGLTATAQSHLGSSTLVTQLDPDAITRQDRKLEKHDEYFERAIWLGCFEMLRRGYSMAEIRDWCSERTELWRAATIAPLPLASPEDEEQYDFEPRSLVLWRRMCHANARDGGTDDYDRAVHGLLAGDIPSVEKVCKSWDDVLFAHYNALLRTQFDSFLIKNAGSEVAKLAQQFPAFNAVTHHSDPITAAKRLITSLETDLRTKNEAMRVQKALQGAIVANDLDRHLFHQGLVLGRLANHRQRSKLVLDIAYPVTETINEKKFCDLGDHDGIRILAHVVIIVNTLDRLSGFTKEGGSLHSSHQAQENIITAYASYLRLANLDEMVPLYCSKLSGDRLYETMGRNLIHIVGDELRSHQLTIMKKLGISPQDFAKKLPVIFLEDVQDQALRCGAKEKFKILEDGPATLKYGRIVKPDFFGEDAEFVDTEDEMIIRTMEWLMLIPGMFVETCTFAVRVYKYFLKKTRLRAARAFSDRVSPIEIVRTKSPIAVNDAGEDPSPAWFEQFANGQLPEDFLEECNVSRDSLVTTVKNLWELECLVRALDAMETLSSLAGLSREESTASREMWQHTSQEVRAARACMQPVLKGWLLTTNDDDKDFKALREAYIPETVLAYISSLHFAGTSLSRDNLLECMDLAGVIAEKGSDVAHEFVRSGRMKELLEAFAACGKALAIWTSDKKVPHTNSRKIKELGWSRELWSVKP
ncbi:nuclear pore protein 84/107 [Podospora fimiseda]|uniref:Nuclear pore complex protein n=1 Tax=Podospora fimiseda TaxID=252190 RepID=A0AAN7BZ28_9PEZI|nr:nuclear pore protein 84/107 [Podospora fimiseda]